MRIKYGLLRQLPAYRGTRTLRTFRLRCAHLLGLKVDMHVRLQPVRRSAH